MIHSCTYPIEVASFRSADGTRKERLVTSPRTLHDVWTSLMERILALERDAAKKNEDVQQLANDLFDEQENQAAAIGTLFEHVHDLDSVAIGVSD